MLSIVTIGLIPILRGDIGTDTPMYQSFASDIISYGDITTSIEPGLIYLFKFLATFLNNEILIVRSVSVLFVLFLVLYVLRSGKDELFFLLAAFIPCLFYIDTMNTIRYGLASSLFLLAVQKPLKANAIDIQSIIFLALACIVHYSTVIAFSFVFLCFHKQSKIWPFVLIFSVSLLLSFIVYLEPEYLEAKASLYSGYESPDWYSGLSSLITILIFLGGIRTEKNILRQISRKIRQGMAENSKCISDLRTSIPTLKRIRWSSLLAGGGAMIIAQYSYAGLRILNILLLCVPVSILYASRVDGQKISNQTKLFLLLGGLAGFTFMYRNFVQSMDNSITPFLPYVFLWDSYNL